MHKAGDVVLAIVQYADTGEAKMRPAVVLFEEFGSLVIAGVTSNLQMRGVPLAKKEGAIKDSVIKLNYIFTISELMIRKKLFSLSKEKKKLVFEELERKLNALLV